MGEVVKKLNDMSAEEYMTWEETQEERHDYLWGEVFAMAGGTLNHNEICFNIRKNLAETFKPRGCRVFSENVKLEIVQDGVYTYPDVLLTCHPEDIKANALAKHPSVLVEVLSPSTQAYDLGTKWEYYQQIGTLQYYLAVSQDVYGVTLFSRTSVEGQWLYEFFRKKDDVIALPFVDASIPMSAIYEGIVFGNIDV